MVVKTKVVIFDLDGVITNTMPYHFRAWKDAFQNIGIRVEPEDVYQREGQRGYDSVFEICAKRNRLIGQKKAQLLLTTKERIFKNIVKQRFVPQARSLMRNLLSRGFRLALVTGTSLREVKRILPVSVWNRFDSIVTGSDVIYGKPHPEPFTKALTRLKIKAKDAVVIENAPFGIASAKAAGIRCLAVETSLPRRYLKKADAVFIDMRDLRQNVIFRRL